MFQRFAHLAITAAAVFAATGCASLHDVDHPLAGKVWDPSAARFISPADLQRRIAHAEVLLLGETHDNPEHHRLQLDTLLTQVRSGRRPILLMEQFEIGQQGDIDAASKDGHDLATLLRGWDATQYRPLLDAAKQAGLVPRAANLPRERLRPVVRDGFSSLASGESERLALQASWDEPREKFMSGVIEASHCGKVSPQLRNGLVRAQRLRDATMADAVLRHMDGPVIFILGRGHARRDVGVPLYIEARRPGTRVLSIGLVEVSAANSDASRYEAERVGPEPAFDVIWFTPRAERLDPCLAFGK